MQDVPEMRVPLARIPGMRGTVVNIDIVRNQHSISYLDTTHRPDFGSQTQITPVTDANLAAMSVGQQTPTNETILADRDLRRILLEVFYRGFITELGAAAKGTTQLSLRSIPKRDLIGEVGDEP